MMRPGDDSARRRGYRGAVDPAGGRVPMAEKGRVAEAPRGQRWQRAMNRLHARLACLRRARARLAGEPEPRGFGDAVCGRAMLAGERMIAGHPVLAPGASPWDVAGVTPDLAEALHGFAWLDDVLAVGGARAHALARRGVRDWIARFGTGRGPGWEPATTGRRLMRWIDHAPLLLTGADPVPEPALMRSLARQVRFLDRRWPAAAAGLPRVEALTGLVQAGTQLVARQGPLAEQAARALDRECAALIAADGGIPSRDPEELLGILTHLNRCETLLRDSGRAPGRELRLAIARIAPVLRSLRHADGGLARFHGGGRGAEGRLDRALADSGVRQGPRALAMGYARLSAGRTTVIADTGRPPPPAHAGEAQAGTLSFELTSGRRPLIVNSGTGRAFGEAWHRASRATPTHSTLVVDGYSSSRLGRKAVLRGRLREPLIETPAHVLVQHSATPEGITVTASHDGYGPSHGLTHLRRLDLSADGRQLSGEDTLHAMSENERIRLERVLDAAGPGGVPFAIRFHLHPEVAAEADAAGLSVTLTLPSGEVWSFRHDGAAILMMEPSVWLDDCAPRPRATSQIVLSAAVMDYGGVVGWTLAKAPDMPLALRDVSQEDAPLAAD